MQIRCCDDHGEPATPPQLTIEVTQRADRTVISLTGELDLCTSQLLPPILDAPVPSAAEVAVDTARVQFLDVRGWRALHGVVERFRRRGHRASIVNASPQVERLTRLLGAIDGQPVPVGKRARSDR